MKLIEKISVFFLDANYVSMMQGEDPTKPCQGTMSAFLTLSSLHVFMRQWRIAIVRFHVYIPCAMNLTGTNAGLHMVCFRTSRKHLEAKVKQGCRTIIINAELGRTLRYLCIWLFALKQCVTRHPLLLKVGQLFEKWLLYIPYIIDIDIYVTWNKLSWSERDFLIGEVFLDREQWSSNIKGPV